MSDNIKILKNYLLYFLLMILVFIVGLSGVFADTITYTDIGYVTEKTTLYVTDDYDPSPVSIPAGTSVPLPSNVRSIIIQVDNQSISANTHYQLEIALYGQVRLTNANVYTVSNSQSVQCDVNYDYSSFAGQYPRWNFACPVSSTHFTIVLSNSNNEAIFSSGTFSWGNAILRYTNSPIHDNGTNDIINNNNQNTQNIINNNNTNTQNIINNQNQNTQSMINEIKKGQLTCGYNYSEEFSYFNSTTNGIIYDNGQLIEHASFRVSDYSLIFGGNIYNISWGNYGTATNEYRITIYNSDKEFLGQVNYRLNDILDLSNYEGLLYIRVNLNSNVNNRVVIVSKDNICVPTSYLQMKQADEQINAINGLNDSLNDDDTTGATSEASDFFSSFTTNTFGLTSIITAPLNLIQSLTSSTCSELHLPLPYLNNKYLNLPCMTTIYQTHFGAFFTMYQTITYGIIAYWVIVRIFNQVKDFKNPEHDEIEVVDL